MANKILLGLLHLLGKDIITVDWLKKHGAIVGDNVDIYNLKINSNDVTCLEIGSNVTLTGVHILTHDASLKRFIGDGCNKVGRVVIGDNVFIGVNTVILPNIKIGNNVIIGAGSVVSESIPDNSVAVGNPARVICSCDEMIKKHKKRMEIESNVYVNLSRANMTADERKIFNEEIDGRIVYLIRK